MIFAFIKKMRSDHATNPLEREFFPIAFQRLDLTPCPPLGAEHTRRMKPGLNLTALGALLLLISFRSFSAEPLTTNDLVGATRVAGLEFSDTEQQMMVKRLNEHLRALEDLRRLSIPNSLAPALLFDPRPAGFVMKPEDSSFDWQSPEAVALPPNRDDLAFYSVAELASLLRARQITSEELTRFFLERLERFGPPLHCVVQLLPERALAAARRADEELQQQKWRGPLHGIPYGVKDLLDVSGVPSAWGVSLYTNRMAEADSTVVANLDRAGAVLLAKLSLGELAMGDVWSGGLTRNPWKPDTGSSGSSAGSASSVSAGLLPFAIGSETLGSIVSPSTVCGITGLRPTFGRVSRFGAMTLCFSLDKLGPLARSAEDCALVLDAMRGPDGKDRSVIEAPFQMPSPDRYRHLRVGFLDRDFHREYGNQTNDLAALEVLRNLGLDLKPISLPPHPKGAFYSILNAEAAASFDELTRSNQDDQLVQQAPGSWPNVFRSARFVTAVDYINANRARTRLLRDMHAIFQQVDVLVAPVWNGNELLYSNMSGHPCVVVPDGQLGGAGNPSLCFLAGLFRESDAVALASAYQRATKWHRQHPDLTALAPANARK